MMLLMLCVFDHPGTCGEDLVIMTTMVTPAVPVKFVLFPYERSGRSGRKYGGRFQCEQCVQKMVLQCYLYAGHSSSDGQAASISS